jgi:hypothetical protein
VAFWFLATGTDLARHRPDALETPLLWLAAAWAFYLPIFAVASITPVAVRRYFGVPIPRYLSALLCGSIAAAITKTMVTSSVAALLSAIVGLVLGALLAD